MKMFRPFARRRTSACRLSTVLFSLVVLLNSLVHSAADDLFTAMDTNHDHSISESEYTAALSKLLGGGSDGATASGGSGVAAITPSLGGDSPPAFSGGVNIRDKLKFDSASGNKDFFKGLFASFSAIIATEIGDKTFVSIGSFLCCFFCSKMYCT